LVSFFLAARLVGHIGLGSRAIKGIDEDMKLNNAIWEMAEILRNRGAQ
jgi:hypothetical protein